MATVCFTVSPTDLARMVSALSTRWGYQATLPNGQANPQSAGEFVRLKIADYVRRETLDHELATAQAAVTTPPITVS
jgi:hypothetical protein